jgi:hypothetical protein
VPIQRFRGTKSAFSGLSGTSATCDDQDSRGYSSATTVGHQRDAQRFNLCLSENSDSSAASFSSALDKDNVSLSYSEAPYWLEAQLSSQREKFCHAMLQPSSATCPAASILFMLRQIRALNLVTAQSYPRNAWKTSSASSHVLLLCRWLLLFAAIATALPVLHRVARLRPMP